MVSVPVTLEFRVTVGELHAKLDNVCPWSVPDAVTVQVVYVPWDDVEVVEKGFGCVEAPPRMAIVNTVPLSCSSSWPLTRCRVPVVVELTVCAEAAPASSHSPTGKTKTIFFVIFSAIRSFPLPP